MTKEKESLIPQNVCIQPGQLHWASRPRNNVLVLSVPTSGSVALTLGLRLHLLSHPSFFMKGNMCLELSSFISLFPAYRILGIQEPSLILFSVPFGPSWQYFCWYKILKNLPLSL